MEQERLQLLKRESKEAEEFVLKLDQEQDNRPLTAAEIQDRKEAKKKQNFRNGSSKEDSDTPKITL
jgi:hypothetical protein